MYFQGMGVLWNRVLGFCSSTWLAWSEGCQAALMCTDQAFEEDIQFFIEVALVLVANLVTKGRVGELDAH